MTSDDYEPKLWPISIEGIWGFIDVEGTVKIEPQFANACPFREGLALVSVFGTSESDLAFDRSYDGFIDGSGQFVIPTRTPVFDPKLEDYDHYGYSSFSDGVAVVRDATGSPSDCGLIDRSGKLIAPMRFQAIDWIGEGLCIAEVRQEEGDSTPIEGYVNYQGQFVLQPENYLYGSNFSEGRAVITIREYHDDYDENDNYYAYDDYQLLIDRGGKVIVGRGAYSSIDPIIGGLSRVRKDDEVGLIDRDGKVVVPLGEFSQITQPDPGTTYLGEKDRGFYAIESDSEPKRLPDFNAEPMRYRGDLIWIRTKDEKNGCARPDGTIVVDPVFDELSFGYDGELAKFWKGSEQGYVNRSGKIVWSTRNWELPLQYSIREPLQSYLPDFVLEAMPLSYNWDCKNAIVFVCSGDLEKLQKFCLEKQSTEVKVTDHSNEFEPGQLQISISFEGVAFLEVFAMHPEPKDAENIDGFVGFYHCDNMYALRKKYPDKTIGIILEN